MDFFLVKITVSCDNEKFRIRLSLPGSQSFLIYKRVHVFYLGQGHRRRPSNTVQNVR